jgi:uncharacterized Zn-binding protein involved in type VI secretion
MLPAARVTDNHLCPAVTGTVPHVGGPVSPPGAVLVLINGLPAARLADMALCAGGPDVIAMGAATVLIDGVPAARITDQTSHGGLILGPGAVAPPVLIGDPTVTIVIKPDADHPSFAVDVQAALAKLLPTPSGAEWLRQMAQNGKTVTIVPSEEKAGCTPASVEEARNTIGTDSTIQWNPNVDVVDPGLPGEQGTPGAHVVLAHEMVHAMHNANGEDLGGPYDEFEGGRGSWRNEERGTVGTGGEPINTPGGGVDMNPPNYSDDFPTENSFRDDLGIPRRTHYFPSNWPGGPPW